MSAPQQQPEWNVHHQRYLCKQWDNQSQRHYWLEYAAYHVRHPSYFQEGRVFAVLWSEPAGKNALITSGKDSACSMVRYGEYVHSQIRRFVIVRHKRSFCYACPINTYGQRGITKPGVDPAEHAIIYSHGHSPRTLPGEREMTIPPIPVVMNPGEQPLHEASRLWFGISYPVQYNIKVKDLGYVHMAWMPMFQSSWKLETHPGVNTLTDISDDIKYDIVRKPASFFKKGRVFMTLWHEARGSSEKAFVEPARFAVVKPSSTFSVCLRISTYAGQATTKAGVVGHRHAAVVPVGDAVEKHFLGEDIIEEPIEVKIESTDLSIDPMSRINFAKPYSVEHNVQNTWGLQSPEDSYLLSGS
ncbi:hypothetical protein ACET3X_002167 [Alternaria dauci]|uniref:DUF6590 domain-containing protein n=1 Tax=Alternaria dauci TaxID=48095 RepID=A0ABR3UP94_9PLEO